MNTRMIGFLLGRILMVEAGLLALPLLTALLYGEPLMPWLWDRIVGRGQPASGEPLLRVHWEQRVGGAL